VNKQVRGWGGKGREVVVRSRGTSSDSEKGTQKGNIKRWAAAELTSGGDVGEGEGVGKIGLSWRGPLKTRKASKKLSVS